MRVRSGLILAAGLGSRLARTDDLPKPLVEVGGHPLLDRAIRQLRDIGCADITVVVGYDADRVTAHLGQDIQVVRNPEYQKSNGLSLLAADGWVRDPFVLTMADHVFDASILSLAATIEPPSGGAVLLVDRKLDQVFDMEDATKVRTDSDGRLLRIGKNLDLFNAVDTGMFVATKGLIDAVRMVAERDGDASLSDGVSILAALGRMMTVDVGAGSWQDVDTPEMLEEAEKRLRDF